MTKVYLIGSLRNAAVPVAAKALREAGFDVFDDWHSAGPDADDFWRDYEKARGRTYLQALAGKAAKNVFNFDKSNLDAADVAVLVAPAGKSAHLELGYMAGKGKPTFVLFDGEPERWDVMYQFATAVVESTAELILRIHATHVLCNQASYKAAMVNSVTKQKQQFQEHGDPYGY